MLKSDIAQVQIKKQRNQKKLKRSALQKLLYWNHAESSALAVV